MATLTYYEKERASLNIGHALQGRGWELLGYVPARPAAHGLDEPQEARWSGIATHARFAGVVVAVNVSDYTARTNSGKTVTTRESAPGAACANCGGTGIEPGAASYAEAMANENVYHQAIAAKARGARLMSGAVSPLHFHEDGSPRCMVCHGRGHDLVATERPLFTYPAFQANPKGKAWHVEVNGRIVASGTGFDRCKGWGSDGQRASARVAEEIETEAQRATQAAQRTAEAAAPLAAAMATTTASRGDRTVTVTYEANPDVWSWIDLSWRLGRDEYVAFTQTFNVAWSRKRRAMYASRRVTAQAVLDHLIPPPAPEVAAAVLSEQPYGLAQLAPAPAEEPAPEAAPPLVETPEAPAEEAPVFSDADRAALHERIFAAIVQLASGTMATLTGLKRYDELDEARDQWLHWFEEVRPHVGTWQEAWNAYEAVGRLTPMPTDTVTISGFAYTVRAVRDDIAIIVYGDLPALRAPLRHFHRDLAWTPDRWAYPVGAGAQMASEEDAAACTLPATEEEATAWLPIELREDGWVLHPNAAGTLFRGQRGPERTRWFRTVREAITAIRQPLQPAPIAEAPAEEALAPEQPTAPVPEVAPAPELPTLVLAAADVVAATSEPAAPEPTAPAPSAVPVRSGRGKKAKDTGFDQAVMVF